MKGFKVQYLLLVTGLLFLFSCKRNGNNAGSEENPAFNYPAVKEVSQKIKDDPKNARLYYDRGNLLHRLKQDTLAIKDFQQAIKLDSTKAEYYSAVGDLMFEHKDISGSRVWLQKAIKLNPEDPRAHLKLAKLLFFLKEYPGAFDQINTVLRADVYNPEAYFLKGRIYQDLKDTNKAISSYQTALQVAPDYKDAMIQLGMVYTDRKNPIAVKYFDNAFKLDTSDVFPIYAKAMFYQNEKDYEKAKEFYRECVARDHQYADAYFNMGYLYLQQDSAQKAWNQFDLVTKITPNDAAAYFNRGLCNELMGKKDAAIADYKQALVFQPDYKEAKDALAKLQK